LRIADCGLRIVVGASAARLVAFYSFRNSKFEIRNWLWGFPMPRVNLGRWSKLALYFLEFYLVVLLALLIYRFLNDLK
jgi:hypothetical protein